MVTALADGVLMPIVTFWFSKKLLKEETVTKK
jgi:hypothetical protein